MIEPTMSSVLGQRVPAGNRRIAQLDHRQPLDLRDTGAERDGAGDPGELSAAVKGDLRGQSRIVKPTSKHHAQNMAASVCRIGGQRRGKTTVEVSRVVLKVLREPRAHRLAKSEVTRQQFKECPSLARHGSELPDRNSLPPLVEFDLESQLIHAVPRIRCHVRRCRHHLDADILPQTVTTSYRFGLAERQPSRIARSKRPPSARGLFRVKGRSFTPFRGVAHRASQFRTLQTSTSSILATRRRS
jgi:hypothetical protein